MYQQPYGHQPRPSAPAPQYGAPQQVRPVPQPGFYPVPGPSPELNGPTQLIPVVPDYQRPAWSDAWQQPPRAGRSGLLAGGLALLVAALVTGVVLLTQGGTSPSTAQPGSGGQTQLPPVPPPTTDRTSIDPVTTVPDTSDPITTAPDTSGPITTPDTPDPVTTPETPDPITTPDTPDPVTTPDTPEPITTPDTSDPVTTPDTSRPAPDPRTADKQAAEQAATAWATAVSSGDFDGVLAVSCDHDREVYASGELDNPAMLAGRYTLTFDRLILSSPYALAYFTIDPDVDGETSLTSFVTSTDGTWKVCMTVTDPSEL